MNRLCGILLLLLVLGWGATLISISTRGRGEPQASYRLQGTIDPYTSSLLSSNSSSTTSLTRLYAAWASFEEERYYFFETGGAEVDYNVTTLTSLPLRIPFRAPSLPDPASLTSFNVSSIAFLVFTSGEIRNGSDAIETSETSEEERVPLFLSKRHFLVWRPAERNLTEEVENVHLKEYDFLVDSFPAFEAGAVSCAVCKRNETRNLIVPLPCDELEGVSIWNISKREEAEGYCFSEE